MQINPYLNFAGTCREAFTFYAQCMGGKIESIMTHGESPTAGQTPPGWEGTIMHAVLRVGDQLIMGSDAPPAYFQKPQGFSVSLVVGDVEEGKRIFDALAAGGAVRMAFEKTFWSPGFGMVTDRFGIPWIVNCR